MKSIKEQIEEAALNHSENIGYGESVSPRRNFISGAEYGFKLAISMLRSEDIYQDIHQLRIFVQSDVCADWLEKQLEGGSNE